MPSVSSIPAAPEPDALAARLGDGSRSLADLAQRERFFEALALALREGTATRLVLSKPVSRDDDLERVTGRLLTLRGEPCVSFVYKHRTKDITKNEPLDAACERVAELVGSRFAHAHLSTREAELQLMMSRKGRYTMHRAKPVGTADATRPAVAAAQADDEPAHDRRKQRWLSLDAPFLAGLGVTDDRHELVPAMARKWKQINKFVEVMAHALESAGLSAQAALSVVDFGAGKGYLTFALHDYLVRQSGASGRVLDIVGVELRPDLVSLCNDVVRRCTLQGLRFEAGDVSSFVPARLDVMIALHACDTATDHALHTGIRAGAAIIMCSPCCHKEIRPQMQMPALLKPMLQHGIHLGQQAEMVTDGLRALLLEAHGYDAQVFEFVALEHTSKNKMILAVRRQGDPASAREQARRDEARAQVDQLKRFYGIREQTLEALLAPTAGERSAVPVPGQA